MFDRSRCDRVLPVLNLQDYFRTSIEEVIARQNVELDPHAAHYVVNLLTLFSRSDAFYEEHGSCYGLRPLALMLVFTFSVRVVRIQPGAPTNSDELHG